MIDACDRRRGRDAAGEDAAGDDAAGDDAAGEDAAVHWFVWFGPRARPVLG